MIPDGFGDPITSFENAYRQTDPDTPYLTHTPSSFGGSSSRGAFAFASHDDSFLRAEHRVPLLYMSHQAAPSSFHIPLLFGPSHVGVLAATSAILAFIVGHPLFVGLYVGFGRNLPHILVRQQLKASFDIHDERRHPTLDPTST